MRKRLVPTMLVSGATAAIASVAFGGCVLAKPDNVYRWGNSVSAKTPAQQFGAPSGVSFVDAENTFDMVVARGTLYTGPGPNTFCDNGIGRTGRVATWRPILTNVVQMSGGNSWGVALRSDGTVWTWGHQQHKWNLGTGQTADQCSPERVPSLTNIVSVAAGGQHGLAVNSSGTVYAWGSNDDGELGLPVTVRGKATPVAVAIGVVGGRVTAGHGTSAVWVPGHSGWAWGQNTFGQLGVGFVSRAVYTPTPIVGISNIAELSWGGDLDPNDHSLLLTTTGKAYATGNNANGQLGNGTTTNSSSFKTVSGLPTIVYLSAGGQHSLFLGASGVVYACGANVYGQVGNNSTSPVFTPVPVLARALHIDAGAERSLASS